MLKEDAKKRNRHGGRRYGKGQRYGKRLALWFRWLAQRLRRRGLGR